MADDASNLKKDEKKDDKKEALPPFSDSKAPTLKDFQKTRIKLQGQGGPRTLLERLKSFRKKDLIFILSGLGVLTLAPLAEHFLVGNQPNGGFQQGWDFKNGLGGFGGGGSPYEPGVNGLAPGQAANGNGDIITPFNARDPASLILGPEAAAQPSVGAPAAASDNSGNSNGPAPWNKVLDAAGGAANAATQSAGLPAGSPVLDVGGLGGDGGGAGGGGETSYAPPSISGVPNKAEGNNSLGEVRGGGVTGGAPFGLTNSEGEGAKAAGNDQSGYFNRPGSAAKGLENAAAVNMPTGGGASTGGSGGGGQEADKADGQDSSKDSKSAGESLAEKAAEQNQQHAIDLYWKKIEAEQMFPITENQKIEDALLMAPVNAIAGKLQDQFKGLFPAPGDDTTYSCTTSDGKAYTQGGPFYLCTSPNANTSCVNGDGMTLVNSNSGTAPSGGSGGGSGNTTSNEPIQIGGADVICTKNASGGAGSSTGGSGSPGQVFGINNGSNISALGTNSDATDANTEGSAAGKSLAALCANMKGIVTPAKASCGIFGMGCHAVTTSAQVQDAQVVLNKAQQLAIQVYNLTGYYPAACGSAPSTPSKEQTALGQINDTAGQLTIAAGGFNSVNSVDSTMLQTISGPLCKSGSGNSCALTNLAHGNWPSDSDFNQWWANMQSGYNSQVLQSARWQSDLNNLNSSLGTVKTALGRAAYEMGVGGSLAQPPVPPAPTAPAIVSANSAFNQIAAPTSAQPNWGIDNTNTELSKDIPSIVTHLQSLISFYSGSDQRASYPQSTSLDLNIYNQASYVVTQTTPASICGKPGCGSQSQSGNASANPSGTSSQNSSGMSLDVYYQDISKDVGAWHTSTCDSACVSKEKGYIVKHSQQENSSQWFAQQAQNTLRQDMSVQNNPPPSAAPAATLNNFGQ